MNPQIFWGVTIGLLLGYPLIFFLGWYTNGTTKLTRKIIADTERIKTETARMKRGFTPFVDDSSTKFPLEG